MSQELSAIMHTAIAHRAAANWEGPKISLIDASGLTAILREPLPKPGLLARLSGKVAPIVAGLVNEQRLQEHLLTEGDVLPAGPGQSMSEASTAAFLSRNAAFLNDMLRRHADQVQYQLTVSWDPKSALRHFSDRLDIAKGQSAHTTAAAAFALQREFAEEFSKALDMAVLDQIEMPSVGPETVLNTVLLMRRDGMPQLDRALEEIDAVWSEGLRLKLVGPLPPLSFALVIAEPFGRREQAEARAALGVSTRAETAEIDSAFRTLAMRSHPDRGGKATDMAALARLRDLLKRADAAGGPDDDSVPLLLARLQRDDQARDVGAPRNQPQPKAEAI